MPIDEKYFKWFSTEAAAKEYWYERMGKFSEMQGMVQIGKNTYCFKPETNDWFISHTMDRRVDDDKRYTTLELIELFINSLNDNNATN